MSEQGFRGIPGVPEGWELVRIGKPEIGEWFIDGLGRLSQAKHDGHFQGCAIIRKIETPKKYRPFANHIEFAWDERDRGGVDWSHGDASPGFFAVVSANASFVWVAFGDVIERFDWEQAFEKLVCRHADNSTSPFGVEVTE